MCFEKQWAESVEDYEIESLRDESQLLGDLAKVELCNCALAGDKHARAECAITLANARMYDLA